MKELAFELTDHERCVTENVHATGLFEAMERYLPWGHVDLSIARESGEEVYKVVDNLTDFVYHVRKAS